jgi:hypothetical protein
VYRIERRESGYLLTFGGVIDAAEMGRWYRDSRRALAAETGKPFGVIVDMRTLVPLGQDAQVIMVDGQALYRRAGMERSAVILSKALVTAQFKRLAKQSGIYDWERYIDASSTERWSEKAVNWVKFGVDPDI